MLQLTLLGKADADGDQLLDVVKRKTAFLFSGCMKLPAIASGRDASTTNSLAAIGMNFGMAFQLVDDLLVFDIDPAKLSASPLPAILRKGS